MSCLRNLLMARHRAVFAFLVLAFAVRAFVPTGYMVGAEDSRFLDIRVCSGADVAASQRIAVEFDEDIPSPVDRPPPEGCAFAALAQAALLPASPLPIRALPPAKTPRPLKPLQTAVQPDFPFLRPPPRAPPNAV